jgi:hypothetical protein
MSPPPVAYIYMDRTSDWLDERSRSQSSSDTPRASATEAKTELKTSSLRRSPKMAHRVVALLCSNMSAFGV